MKWKNRMCAHHTMGTVVQYNCTYGQVSVQPCQAAVHGCGLAYVGRDVGGAQRMAQSPFRHGPHSLLLLLLLIWTSLQGQLLQLLLLRLV